MGKKMTFALAFANRGFMPGELIYGARSRLDSWQARASQAWQAASALGSVRM